MKRQSVTTFSFLHDQWRDDWLMCPKDRSSISSINLMSLHVSEGKVESEHLSASQRLSLSTNPRERKSRSNNLCFFSSYCSLARERWKEKRWSWSFPGFPSLAAVIFLLAERKKEKKRPTEWRWRQWWLLFDRLKALLSQEKIKEKVGQAVSVSRAYCGPHESASSAGPQF